MVRQLLQAGARLDEFDHAPLRRALRGRHAEVVRILLAAGVDISAQADEFLEIATENGDAICLKLLLNHMQIRIAPNVLDRVFYAAIASRNPAAVKILLRVGANPAAEDNRPVMEASCAGSVEILRLLHRHGADLHAQNGQALCNTVIADHQDAARFLIDSGANINARLNLSVTLAVSYGHTAMLEMLLRAGGKLADPSLIVDTADNDSLESLMILLDYGYRLSPYIDEIVRTAARRAAPRILKYVLETAQVAQSSLDAALEHAAGNYNENVVELLLNHGADASVNCSAALKIAIESRQFNLARRLIAAGADARRLNSYSLVITIKAKQWPLFITLLQSGVSVASTLLRPEQAVEFVAHITAAQLLRDTQGISLPASMRAERQRFAKATANTAARASGDDAIKVACWLTTILIELNSCA